MKKRNEAQAILEEPASEVSEVHGERSVSNGTANDLAAEWVAPTILVPWSKNPKGLEPRDIREMKRSIRRFGFGAPIVARRANHEIIEGHLRHAAALALHLERVPCRYLDISADEAHLLAVAAWKFEHRREADENTIAEILEDLEDRGVDIEIGTGFDEVEINHLLDAAGAAANESSSSEEQNFAPATAAEQSRLDVKLREVVCPKCRHEFVA